MVVGRQVRVEVERKPGVSRQAVLVTGPDDARLDVDAAGLGDHDDTEVRRRSGETKAKDLLEARAGSGGMPSGEGRSDTGSS